MPLLHRSPLVEINPVEVLAIHRTIQISLINSDTFKARPMVLESDSTNAVRWCGKAIEGPWNLRFILNFINVAPSKGLNISIIHRGRSSNVVADALVKQGLHRTSEFVAWLQPPVMLPISVFCCFYSLIQFSDPLVENGLVCIISCVQCCIYW